MKTTLVTPEELLWGENYPECMDAGDRNWIEYFRALAEVVSTKSKDYHTKIGAVIVGWDNSILSTGYNSFPRGINDDVPERQERPEKYFWFEHAERNAIYNAARNGVRIQGARIFLNCGLPCADCARGIINSGINEVWCERGNTTKNPTKWNEHFERTTVLFEEANVDRKSVV